MELSDYGGFDSDHPSSWQEVGLEPVMEVVINMDPGQGPILCLACIIVLRLRVTNLNGCLFNL